MKFAQRMGRLGTETAFDVLARAKALEAQGRADRPSGDRRAGLRHARATSSRPACDALRAGYTHYGPRPASRSCARRSPSTSAERAASPFAPERRRRHARAASRSCSSPSWRWSSAGDEVIYPNPGFPIYESMIHFVGARAGPAAAARGARLPLRCRRAVRRWSTERTRLIILNSPHNPTGGMLDAAPISSGSPRSAAEHDLLVLSDEIYTPHPLRGRAHRASPRCPGMLERTIILDGFSKTYAMTGWRLGYGVFPRELVPRVHPADDQLHLLHARPSPRSPASRR